MNIINKFTLRTLKKNKVRTLITIFGIILSVSMITAVTTFISSLRNYLINSCIAESGNWYGAVLHLSKEEIEQLTSSKDVTEFGINQNIGYAQSNSLDENKPYIFIMGIGEGFTKNMPVRMIAGRLPSNSDEIVLPRHLQTNGGVSYQLGDHLTLEIGDRFINNISLYQTNGFVGEKDNDIPEQLVIRETRQYTVVGFYERPGFESYSAPGYAALTRSDRKEADNYDVYFKLEHPKEIYRFIENNFPEKEATYNSDYLRMLGASNESNYNRVLYGLAGVLIVIIMFGSISLIYNAFSISVSERMKQFGLISSIGATKKQILNSVLFEAMSLCVIGIPLGIISGILGIGVTLSLTSDLFLSFLRDDVVMQLTVSFWSVITAIVVSLLTVLISAYLPARRAVKVPAIEAIRQTTDINIKAKKVKTSKLTYHIFGFEGMIAAKNFKRNRRKYRATVVSLFVSVVLFISTSSFCDYLTKSVSRVIDDLDYDIVYQINPDDLKGISLDQLAQTLRRVEGITDSNYMYNVYTELDVNQNNLNKDYLEYMVNSYKENGVSLREEDKGKLFSCLSFIEDASYDKFVEKLGISAEDQKTPVAVAIDTVKFYNTHSDKYNTFRLLNKNSFDCELTIEKELNGTTSVPIHIGKVTENGPVGVGSNYGGNLKLIFPMRERKNILGTDKFIQPINVVFQTTNHKNAFDNLYKTLVELKLPTLSLYDTMENNESNSAMVTVVRIFSYGFIVLISLIASANVFNTISTNIALRRVEFAMLRSVGMTDRGFHKMMNFECLLYGIKGLLYGVPVSIMVTYLIYHNISFGLNMAFFLPWNNVLIAIGSVFAVVFATMIYSMNKIRKENTIDALKNENI